MAQQFGSKPYTYVDDKWQVNLNSAGSQLCAAPTLDDPLVQDVQRLLSIAESCIGGNYPTSAKYVLQHLGVPVRPISRTGSRFLTAHQTTPLVDLFDFLRDHGYLDLTPSNHRVAAAGGTPTADVALPTISL